MAAVDYQALRRSTSATQWIAFAVQVLIAISFEIGDDIGRGLFSQHGTAVGIRDARQIVSFETAHSLWVEPGWQLFFLQTRHFLAFTVSWLDVAHVMNLVYVGCHVLVTLGVGAWVYFFRRKYFVLLRNVIMMTNALALVVYENFPVAPPRLTTGLTWNHHAFTFEDTVFGVWNGGRLVSQQLAYNEFSAMPSVHIAWAMIVAVTVILLARSTVARILAALYPALMLIAVVVTGNHYLLDAAGAVPVVVGASIIAFGVANWPGARAWPEWVRQYVVGNG